MILNSRRDTGEDNCYFSRVEKTMWGALDVSWVSDPKFPIRKQLRSSDLTVGLADHVAFRIDVGHVEQK